LYVFEERTIMPSVSITELKAHLAEYLRRTRDGERFFITVRGREVAELRPPDPERAALWSMVEAGDAQWSGDYMVVPADLPKNDGPLVSDVVSEDRGPYPDDPLPELP
jgi:prevent-host-death family protein